MLVNGAPARASLKLKSGDRLLVEVPDRADPSLVGEDLPLVIVFEDEHVLVIDKPPGMVVHPGAGVRAGTLVHALLHHDPAIAGVGGTGRPGIVHRLDKDTSGLLVVARTERAYRALIEAMKRREIHRHYRAIVWGVPPKPDGRIDDPLGRDPRDRKRMAIVRGGKPAATVWEVRGAYAVAAELDVRLETGRTHQIRVHLRHIGHPVVGDPVYGGRSKKQLSLSDSERSLARALLECLPRQALHASELILPHPLTGGSLRFASDVPDDYHRALELLQAHQIHRRH